MCVVCAECRADTLYRVMANEYVVQAKNKTNHGNGPFVARGTVSRTLSPSNTQLFVNNTVSVLRRRRRRIVLVKVNLNHGSADSYIVLFG